MTGYFHTYDFTAVEGKGCNNVVDNVVGVVHVFQIQRVLFETQCFQKRLTSSLAQKYKMRTKDGFTR